MKNVVIVDACRTAVGSMGGSLKPLSAYDLACAVLKGTLERSGIDPKEVDEVVLGHCRQTSDEPNIARMAALKVGIPETASAYTVMRQCASAMTAVQNGAMSIMCGLNDVVIAGGTESMSNAVFYLRNARWGLGTGNTELVDALTEGQFRSQPQEVYGRYNMGATAENIAQELHISRQAQDEFSLTSQRRAVAAIDAGKFKDEIVPVEVPQGRKSPPSSLIPTSSPAGTPARRRWPSSSPASTSARTRKAGCTALPSLPAPSPPPAPPAATTAPPPCCS